MGDLIKEGLRNITDGGPGERFVSGPLVVMTLLLGVYPSLVTDMIGPTVEAMLSDVTTAQAEFRADTMVATGEGQ